MRRIIFLLMLLQLQDIPREMWVHPLNEQRSEKGEFYQLYPDLRHFPVRFFRYYWMSVEQFDYLLEKLSDKLSKKPSNLRLPISAEQQLVLMLRYSVFCSSSKRDNVNVFVCSIKTFYHEQVSKNDKYCTFVHVQKNCNLSKPLKVCIITTIHKTIHCEQS